MPTHDANTVVVAIRNTGSIDATIESVWVRPNTAGSTWYKDDASLRPYRSARQLTLLLIPSSLVLVVNTSYVWRVTTTTGFYYEFISTTPASF